VVPVLEQKAADAGEPPPPAAWRAALRRDGPRWIFWQLGALALLGVASMALDRLRALKKERGGGTISPDD
jgi:hypothetical protein